MGKHSTALLRCGISNLAYVRSGVILNQSGERQAPADFRFASKSGLPRSLTGMHIFKCPGVSCASVATFR
jgi:hypothetical protein